MTAFHCVVEAAPSSFPDPKEFDINGISVNAFTLSGGEAEFSISFEEVAQRLEALPRMFFELDGSFVWVVEKGDSRFQLDGSLYDDGERLLTVDLKGTCDQEMLDHFLKCLGWPKQSLVFQLVQRGIYLDEECFRKCCVY